MSNQSNVLTQIQQKEADMDLMLKKTQEDNNARVVAATEEGAKAVSQAEDEARTEARGKMAEAREKAKSVYKDELAAAKSRQHNVVEGGKGNADKAKAHVKDAIYSIFK